MEEELSRKEKYERLATFYYIKNGKPLVRKGLANRILFLSIQRRGNIIRSQSLKDNCFDRQCVISIKLDEIELKKFNLSCEHYLKEFKIETEYNAGFWKNKNLVNLFYRKQNVRWDLLDEDLISLYPENIVIRNNIPYIRSYVNPIYYRTITDINVTQGGEEDSCP